MYNNALGLGAHVDGTQTKLENQDEGAQFGAVGRDVYATRKRERRRNIRLDLEALNAETILRLQRSRSGHQGHLRDLNDKISVLLNNTNNAEVVKELSELFKRQRKRFSLVHEEIMLFASRGTSAVSSATHVCKDQFVRKTKLLEKVNNYLQAESIHVNGTTLMDDLEPRSNAKISSSDS